MNSVQQITPSQQGSIKPLGFLVVNSASQVGENDTFWTSKVLNIWIQEEIKLNLTMY